MFFSPVVHLHLDSGGNADVGHDLAIFGNLELSLSWQTGAIQFLDVSRVVIPPSTLNGSLNRNRCHTAGDLDMALCSII